jgi:hypothetical protein
MMDKAPTRPKALARLLPITIMTHEVETLKSMNENISDCEYESPLWFFLYATDRKILNMNADTRFRSITGVV